MVFRKNAPKFIFGFQLICLLFMICECSETNSTSMKNLKVLYNNLLNGYDIRIKPRDDQSSQMNVSSNFTLNGIIDLDTTGQRVEVLGYFNFQWTDDSLVWNPDDYGGITAVKIPLYQIWFPYILLNSADGRTLLASTEIERADVTFDGNVEYFNGGLYSFTCEVSVKYYPFDQQNCQMIYFIANEDTPSVQFLLSNIYSMPIIENSEWDIDTVAGHVDTRYSTNIIYLSFTLNRRPQFVVYTMIIPLITLSVLNAFTLLVPIESGEKGALTITIFLAYDFFISIMKDHLPHNSKEVSYYLVYITVLLVFSGISVIYAIFEARLYAKFGATVCRKKYKVVNHSKIEVLSGTKDVSKEVSNKTMKDGTDGNITWADYLKTVDSIACIVSFVSLIIFHCVLLGTMMNRGQ